MAKEEQGNAPTTKVEKVEGKVTFKKPVERRIRGEISSIDTLPEGKGILISIYSVDDEKDVNVITSENQLEKFTRNGEKYSDLFKPKAQVAMVCEEHIEDETGYVDADGLPHRHTSSGLALRTMQNLSSFEIIKLNAELSQQVNFTIRRKNLAEDIKTLKDAYSSSGLFTDPEELKDAVIKSVRM